MTPFLLMRAGAVDRFSSLLFEVGLQTEKRARINVRNDLVRVVCTIGERKNDDIHFFIAGKRINQAKPLLCRFFAGSPPVLRRFSELGLPAGDSSPDFWAIGGSTNQTRRNAQ